MLEYCLICDYEEEIKPTRSQVIMTIRGEDIEVTKEFYKCPACGETFTSSLGHNALDQAYREYRRRHDMLQPEDICQWRKYYGLTPTEVSHLLGWETTTLNDYENGALQEESEDTLLQLTMVPSNLLRLITKKPHAVSTEKRNQLIALLSSNREEEGTPHLEPLYAY